MKIKEIISEKLNMQSLTRGFVKEKDMGWYKLIAAGDQVSRMANDPPTMTISAILDDGGHVIGELDLRIAHGMYLRNHSNLEGLVAGGVYVDDQYQRKGVATAMYNFAKELGNDIIPSVDQSDDAKAMWAGMKSKGTAPKIDGE